VRIATRPARGDEPRGHHLHPLRLRLQDHAGRAPLRYRHGHCFAANNRDKNGINGDFLCIKGALRFDFFDHKDRLRQPLVRKNGKLEPPPGKKAIEHVGKRLREIRDSKGAQAIA